MSADQPTEQATLPAETAPAQQPPEPEQQAPQAPQEPQPPAEQPPAAEPKAEAKKAESVIVRFRGVNIPGGRSLTKAFRVSKDKTLEHLNIFIHKQLKIDHSTTFVCRFHGRVVSFFDTAGRHGIKGRSDR